MIPTPQYYVFYNGNEKRPEREILKLSDAFKVPVGEGCFEWTATVLNINYGCNKELMEKCSILEGYAIMVAKIKEFRQETEDQREAILQAINYCIENGVLIDFLQEHRSEVLDMFMMEYDEEMVREAIKRELSRGGQVYYVFNRVNQIADMTAKISELVPEASVAYAHGQMRERELEDIMYQFINGEIDVLVSTTIIETGLDISNANTMIVHDADNMGLSQLYQLRGRIGRSNRTSYAFLMYRRNKMLREVAEKRLSAIREFSELGSGFKIAMKDLEIRGAGNLLGAQQHGHMEAVGYDLYCKMLNQAVKTVKGEREESDDFETVLELDLDAYIPASYIPNENQKLDIYKRIACIENEEESSEMMDELIDRFGDPPKSVENLLLIAQLKALAHKVYLTEVSEKSSEIRFQLYEKAKVDAAKIPEIVELFRPYLNFRVDSKAPGFYYRKRKGGPDTLTVVKNFLTLMEQKLLLT